VKKYHQFLVWDLMKKPILTRILEFILQPLMGKSVVMYFRKIPKSLLEREEKENEIEPAKKLFSGDVL
jgi:hypothetical protein